MFLIINGFPAEGVELSPLSHVIFMLCGSQLWHISDYLEGPINLLINLSGVKVLLCSAQYKGLTGVLTPTLRSTTWSTGQQPLCSCSVHICLHKETEHYTINVLNWEPILQRWEGVLSPCAALVVSDIRELFWCVVLLHHHCLIVVLPLVKENNGCVTVICVYLCGPVCFSGAGSNKCSNPLCVCTVTKGL